jgi:toxin-antitoxin system PIN domain toxin
MAEQTLGDLPDLNVWLALLNANHPHHAAAKRYWEEEAAGRIAFCRITMLGLLRLSTNKVVMGGSPYSPDEAWQAYQAVAALPEVSFITEPQGIEALLQEHSSAPTFRRSDWTDAYLAAFAQFAGLRLVSFDKGFANYKGLALLSLPALSA